MSAIVLSGCRPVGKSADNSPADGKDARTAEVTLIASGDTHGWIMPCGCTSNQSGGLLRRATYVAQKRQTGEVVVVDVGGAADGIAPYQLEKFKAILAGEKLMNLSAHNLGAAEIAFGPETIRDLASSLQVPFVSRNARDARGNLLVDSHKLLDVGGRKLLITGVVSPTRASPEVRISEPADAILQVLSSVREPVIRLIVLAYLPADELRSLAETLPEAEAVIGGPTGQSLAPEWIGHVLMTSATNKGKFLAELTLPGDAGKQITARVVEMSPDFVDDPEQRQNLDAFRGELARRDFTAQQSGFVTADRWAVSGDQHVAGSRSCFACHATACKQWETSGHAHAWRRLVDENADADPYCQQCHSTGYGWNGGFVSARRSANRVNVGCESCHGPSAAHISGAGRTPFDAPGQCIKCHDPENSPHFDYDKYWERIFHE